MKHFMICLTALLFVGALPAQSANRAKYEAKLKASESVLVDAMNREGKSIPPELLTRAKAIAIFPGVVKAGFVFGGRYGEGVVLSHNEDGSWSAPAFFTIAGGSYGLQIGIQSMDIVLLIMNQKGLEALLKQRATLGADIGVTAGPASVSADADIDVFLKADILSYTRARGLFAGIAVNGARVAVSNRMNREFYGRSYSVDDIIIQKTVPVKIEAHGLITTLGNYSAHSAR